MKALDGLFRCSAIKSHCEIFRDVFRPLFDLLLFQLSLKVYLVFPQLITTNGVIFFFCFSEFCVYLRNAVLDIVITLTGALLELILGNLLNASGQTNTSRCMNKTYIDFSRDQLDVTRTVI
jgi:hypothetical protein